MYESKRQKAINAVEAFIKEMVTLPNVTPTLTWEGKERLIAEICIKQSVTKKIAQEVVENFIITNRITITNPAPKQN